MYYISRPHYDLLDGLRGVAALIVLVYHLFEAIAFAAGAPEQDLYHGFLAVDFFFILSGFVMGYAYDGRWGKDAGQGTGDQGLSVWDFFKRRLIRLHPMVVAGVVVGAIAFIIQGCTRWDGSVVSTSMLLWATLLALFLLPVAPAMDVRGNTELFPINGPHWSLFLEYIGSILYALLLRKLSTRALKIWVAVSALALLANGILEGEGTIGYGWSSAPLNLLGGFLRLSVGYPMGLLLARLYKEHQPTTIKGPIFTCCAVILFLLLLVPNLNHHLPSFLSSTDSGTVLCTPSLVHQWLCVVVFFPLIIWMAARGVASGFRQRAISFLGRLSYPLYAIHYPLIYLYIDWINRDLYPFAWLGTAPWITPLVLAVIAITLATCLLLWYDEPLRKWLSQRK